MYIYFKKSATVFCLEPHVLHISNLGRSSGRTGIYCGTTRRRFCATILVNFNEVFTVWPRSLRCMWNRRIDSSVSASRQMRNVERAGKFPLFWELGFSGKLYELYIYGNGPPPYLLPPLILDMGLFCDSSLYNTGIIRRFQSHNLVIDLYGCIN